MPYNPQKKRDYNPLLDGPPTYPDTAETLEDFNVEAEQFRRSLVDSGMGVQPGGPGTAIFNAQAYSPGSARPQDFRDYLTSQGATWVPDAGPRDTSNDVHWPGTPPTPPPVGYPAPDPLPPKPNRLDYWENIPSAYKVGEYVPTNTPGAYGNPNMSCPTGQVPILQANGSWVCQVPPSQTPVVSTGNPETDMAIRFSGSMPILLGGGNYASVPGETLGLNAGQIGTVINNANPCGYLPDGPLKVACQIAQGIYNAATGQPNAGGNLGGVGGVSPFVPGSSGPCSVGYHWNDMLGTCVSDDITTVLPGGTPYTTGVGVPIGGNMGAVKPRQVGTVARDDGKVTPLFRCPRGMVLGVDYNCYWKQLLPRQWRANPPARRPLLSAHDGMILNKAKGLEKKLRKVTNKHVHKPCHCKTVGRRKK